MSEEYSWIYIGSVSVNATEAELRELLEQYGVVISLELLVDETSGRLRGVAVAQIPREDIKKFITSLNGIDFYGRSLRVENARLDNI